MASGQDSATRDESVVRIERPRPGIGVLRIDRPAQRNALNLAVKRELAEGLAALEADTEVSIIIVTGSDRFFVAGTDIAEMRAMSAEDHAKLGTNDLWIALRACPKLLISAVEGYALGGGCELMLSCDMVVLSETAKIGQPEIRVGIMPGAGGSQYLLRTIGRYRAAKMILTGEFITGSEAGAMGLASEVVPEGSAYSRALELAEAVAGMPAVSVLASKSALKAGLNGTLDEGIAFEREAFVGLFGKPDQQEGMQAFLDKRPAQFNRGRVGA